MTEFPEYLYTDLMDDFHWTDLNGVTIHEMTAIHNMALGMGFQIEFLPSIQLWVKYSQSMNAQFLLVDLDNIDYFGRFINDWINKNK